MHVMRFDQKSCERIRQYLDSYLSNELLIETNHEVLRHVETCQACAEALAARMRVKQLLQRAVRQDAAPPGLWAAVQRTLQEYESKGRVTAAWVRWALAASVVFALALGGWGTLRWWRTRDMLHVPSQARLSQPLSEQVMTLLTVGVDDHVYCALDHRFAKQRFTLDRMAQAMGPTYRGLVPVVIEHLPKSYEVVVAHRCTVHGRRFVHLIVTHHETVLSLVIMKKENVPFPNDPAAVALKASGVSLYQARVQGLEAAGFETQECVVFVVSNLAPSENVRLASTLAPPVRDFLDRVERSG